MRPAAIGSVYRAGLACSTPPRTPGVTFTDGSLGCRGAGGDAAPVRVRECAGESLRTSAFTCCSLSTGRRSSAMWGRSTGSRRSVSNASAPARPSSPSRPNPTSYARIRHNEAIREAGVVVEHLAASDEAGRVAFNTVEAEPWQSSLLDRLDDDAVTTATVDAVRLDELPRRHRWPRGALDRRRGRRGPSPQRGDRTPRPDRRHPRRARTAWVPLERPAERRRLSCAA